MLNDGTEAVINFLLYPVIFAKNLVADAERVMAEQVIPRLTSQKLDRVKLLLALNDALSKDGWKNECAVSVGLSQSEELIKEYLNEILRRVQGD